MNRTNFDENHVAILMATYNGEEFILKQLESIKKQLHENWSLHISDDGSSDNTLSIIESFSKCVKQRIKVYNGPKKGFAQNFLSLVRCGDIQANYFAFCDQDDIWLPERLSVGLEWAVSQSTLLPVVFFSRSQLIDVDGNVIGCSPLFKKKESYSNALVQSIGGGNTMLFNDASRDLLSQIPETYNVIAHDWTSYQVISACGGVVKYSDKMTIQYRQHSSNIIGANSGLKNLIRRLNNLISGQLSIWNESNLNIMKIYSEIMTAENKRITVLFKRARSSFFFAFRLYFFVKSGVYRQTFLGRMSLYLAIVLRRL